MKSEKKKSEKFQKIREHPVRSLETIACGSKLRTFDLKEDSQRRFARYSSPIEVGDAHGPFRELRIPNEVVLGVVVASGGRIGDFERIVG